MRLLLSVSAYLLVANACIPAQILPDTRAVQLGQDTVASSTLRSCSASNASDNKKKRGRAKVRENLEPVACVEVPCSPLDVQEYLQKFTWESKWNAEDEQTSENLWSISIALTGEELLTYAKPFSDPQIDWQAGKVRINVQTATLPDNFTRVLTNARFEGYGKQHDQFAPKRNSWPVDSNGLLEAKIIGAIREHFKSAR
jgi:hypothetical protein